MTSIGLFSTDWVQEPVVDELASARAGRQVFIEHQKRLSFGGTFLQRGAMPGMELNNHGYDNHLSWRFNVAPDGHIRTLDINGEWHDPDIFWSQRWMHRDAVDQIQRARSTGQICIADLDDAFHALPKTNIAAHTTDPKNNPDFNRDHYWRMLAVCDAVTTSTESLRREMERIGVPAFVVRNAIQIERWQPKDPGSDLVVGWVGGVQWRSHDLEQLKTNRVYEFLEDYAIPFCHGGDSQVDGVAKAWDLAGIDPAVIKCISAPICHISDYPSLWDPITISLIPLEQCAFNHGKSFLKALESCAAGIPYIVSAGFPEQQILIDEGSAGRLARNTKPSDWRNHLADLLDPEVRREEGKINRSVAERHDIRERWVDWANAYEAILSTR